MSWAGNKCKLSQTPLLWVFLESSKFKYQKTRCWGGVVCTCRWFHHLFPMWILNRKYFICMHWCSGNASVDGNAMESWVSTRPCVKNNLSSGSQRGTLQEQMARFWVSAQYFAATTACMKSEIRSKLTFINIDKCTRREGSEEYGADLLEQKCLLLREANG